MQGRPISGHLSTQLVTQTPILISALSANPEDLSIPLEWRKVSMMCSRRLHGAEYFSREFDFLFLTSPDTILGGIDPGTSGTGAGCLTARPQQLLGSREN